MRPLWFKLLCAATILLVLYQLGDPMGVRRRARIVVLSIWWVVLMVVIFGGFDAR